MFDHAVATTPDRVSLRHLDTVLTYREEGRAVAALAGRLATLAAPGEAVALALPNSAEFRIAYFATLKALAEPALLNPLYPAAQLEPLLRAAGPHTWCCARPRLGIPCLLWRRRWGLGMSSVWARTSLSPIWSQPSSRGPRLVRPPQPMLPP